MAELRPPISAYCLCTYNAGNRVLSAKSTISARPFHHTREERAALSEDTDGFPLDVWVQHRMQALASAIAC
jgi:hypothetical protein